MATTPNGYPIIDDYGSADLIPNPVVPGTGTTIFGGINRKYAPILIWVAQQFNARVEPIKQGDPADDWGYNKRQSRNSSNMSEHSGGTAIDLNASGHPNGQRPAANLTPAQIKTIRAIVAETGGAVIWGGDWNDAQHFELSRNRAAVDRFLAKLTAGKYQPPSSGPPAPAPTGKPPWPFPLSVPVQLLGRVDDPSMRVHGGDPRYDGPGVFAAIRWLQQRLKAKGYDLVVDGIFGARTEAAVAAWQRAEFSSQTTRFGEVWSDDWARL